MILDSKSKLFIGLYMLGRGLNGIGWLLDIFVEASDGDAVFLIFEFIDFASTYIVTLGLYIFIIDILKVKILLESESL